MNGRSIDTEFSNHFLNVSALPGFISAPDGANCFIINPDIAITRTNGAAALCGSIVHIVLCGTQKQMIRIYARRVVATVANLLSGGYRSKVNLVRYSRRDEGDLLTIPCYSDDAIALFGRSASPNPAIALRPLSGSLINIQPETLSQGLPSRKQIAVSAAKLSRNLLKVRGATGEFIIALLACATKILDSHDLNLLHRLGLWSGSLAAQTACGPSSF